jgi:hypothetical protein
MNSIYFLKIKKIAENKLFCVCVLLTERQHTCDKQKHKIMISYNSLPPRGGGGGHCKPQLYYLHQLNANKTVMKSPENWERMFPPQSTVGMSIPIFTWPVSSAHRGEKWKFLSLLPPSLAAQLRLVKNSKKKICFIGHIKCPV